MENGQEVEQRRKVEVHAGDRLTVNFPMPRAIEGRTPAAVPPLPRSEEPPADLDRTSRPDRTPPDRTRTPADRTAPSDKASPDRPPDRTPPADRPPDR